MKTNKNTFAASISINRNKINFANQNMVRTNQTLYRRRQKEEEKPDIFELNQCFDNFFTKLIH